MKIMTKFVRIIQSVSLLVAIFNIGCASTPYNSKRAIESKGSMLSRTYSQGGKSVSRFEVLSDLASNPATKEEGSSARNYIYGGYGLAGAGAALAIGSMVGGGDSSGMLLDLALVAGGVALLHFGDSHLDQAIDKHNGSHGHHHSAMMSLDLQVAQNVAANSAKTPLLGVKLQF